MYSTYVIHNNTCFNVVSSSMSYENLSAIFLYNSSILVFFENLPGGNILSPNLKLNAGQVRLIVSGGHS